MGVYYRFSSQSLNKEDYHLLIVQEKNLDKQLRSSTRHDDDDTFLQIKNYSRLFGASLRAMNH